MEGKEKEAEDLVMKAEEGKTVMLAPKEFVSAVEMYDYFSTLLESWSPHLDFNKYEYMVLEDLVTKKGHAEPSQMIGAGIEAFGIRHHPKWESRCFFVHRVDGTIDDFSFRKCVNKILSLPRGLSTLRKSNGNKGGGGRGGGGRGGGGGSRGGGGYRGRGRQGN